MKIRKFKYNETGLNRFFGPLEARIMDALWDAGTGLSIREVQARLETEQSSNFNTVMTVMNRLVEKGLLNRRIEGRTSLYRPMVSKETFMNDQSKELTHELIDEFGPLVVNHMLDALDQADPELIDKLEQKIRLLKKRS